VRIERAKISERECREACNVEISIAEANSTVFVSVRDSRRDVALIRRVDLVRTVEAGHLSFPHFSRPRIRLAVELPEWCTTVVGWNSRTN
jgi:hypothetical protein